MYQKLLGYISKAGFRKILKIAWSKANMKPSGGKAFKLRHLEPLKREIFHIHFTQKWINLTIGISKIRKTKKS
jgi:hypothetical protein